MGNATTATNVPLDYKEAEAEIAAANDWRASESGKSGFCHILWFEQKRILKEIYCVDWKTPAEMNPDTLFDCVSGTHRIATNTNVPRITFVGVFIAIPK